MSLHSIFPPSSASVWGVCTGWVEMMKTHDELEPSESALEGEASHEVGVQLIRYGTTGGRSPAPLKAGGIASNGILITDEIYEGAIMYFEDVISVFANWVSDPNMKGGYEERVDIMRVHAECFGTPDTWLYSPAANHLTVWDYKFGHVFVPADENMQGVCYIAGLETKLAIPNDATVEVRIVQPRAYGKGSPIRSWSTTMRGLYPYITDLSTAAHAALSDRAELKTGPHCRYCDARTYCTPCLAAGMGFYEMAYKPVPCHLTPDAMGLQLSIIERALEQLKGLKTGFEEQVKATIKKGTPVPGWELRPSVGREKWDRPVSEIINLGKLLGVDLEKPGVVTPKEARKLGLDDQMVKAHSMRPINGLTLTPEDATLVARVFGKELKRW